MLPQVRLSQGALSRLEGGGGQRKRRRRKRRRFITARALMRRTESG
jgi:hypothetical protein